MAYGLHKAEVRRKSTEISSVYSFIFLCLAFLVCLIANPLGIIYKMASYTINLKQFFNLNYIERGYPGYRRRKFLLPLLLLIQIFVNPLILMFYMVP